MGTGRFDKAFCPRQATTGCVNLAVETDIAGQWPGLGTHPRVRIKGWVAVLSPAPGQTIVFVPWTEGTASREN